MNELDFQVAVKVLGWIAATNADTRSHGAKSPQGKLYDFREIPRFSSDRQYLRAVTKKLAECGYSCAATKGHDSDGTTTTEIVIVGHKKTTMIEYKNDKDYAQKICEFALGLASQGKLVK